jgi:hypothetical protein
MKEYKFFGTAAVKLIGILQGIEEEDFEHEGITQKNFLVFSIFDDGEGVKYEFGDWRKRDTNSYSPAFDFFLEYGQDGMPVKITFEEACNFCENL